jgi:hypothetical protein
LVIYLNMTGRGLLCRWLEAGTHCRGVKFFYYFGIGKGAPKEEESSATSFLGSWAFTIL